jgi:hypothetical protein
MLQEPVVKNAVAGKEAIGEAVVEQTGIRRRP